MIPSHILFCSDFSTNSAAARKVAFSYAQVFTCDLTILHVIDSKQIGYPQLDDTMPPEIRKELDRITKLAQEAVNLISEECRQLSGQVQTRILVGIPVDEIINYAELNHVDLIVLGTHGRTDLRHLIMGSTSENVVKRAPCPVLTVNPRAQDSAAVRSCD